MEDVEIAFAIVIFVRSLPWWFPTLLDWMEAEHRKGVRRHVRHHNQHH